MMLDWLAAQGAAENSLWGIQQKHDAEKITKALKDAAEETLSMEKPRNDWFSKSKHILMPLLAQTNQLRGKTSLDQVEKFKKANNELRRQVILAKFNYNNDLAKKDYNLKTQISMKLSTH